MTENTESNQARVAAGLSGNVELPAATLPPPPRRTNINVEEDVSDPIHYARDPQILIAYLVPFPIPETGDSSAFPKRFLIYTPPPPPLRTPKEGEKEGKVTKVQRRWQEEVRQAKKSDAKVTSWTGVKSRATKGIDSAMKHTTSSGLDFMNRIPHGSSQAVSKDSAAPEEHSEPSLGDPKATPKSNGLKEMMLVHPESLQGTQEEIREEFVSSMLRTKSKAQKDSVIATGLMPVAFAVDVLATVVWPFGGLVEIDAVWGAASMRGAKTARSVTKRLDSTKDSAAGSDADKQTLQLTFKPSRRVEILRRYLSEQCHHRDSALFKSEGVPPTESDVLEAIGWTPSASDAESKNLDDEQWERSEVKEDIRSTMRKAAGEWDKWCKAYEKDAAKALRK